jgi:hypothetical protein
MNSTVEINYEAFNKLTTGENQMKLYAALTSLMTGMTGLTFGSSALAMNFVDLAAQTQRTTLENQIRAVSKQNRKVQDTCVNFSGDWAGECNASTPEGEKTYKSQFRITQDRCDVITFEDEQGKSQGHALGGVASMQGAVGQYFSNLFIILDWNKDRTELTSNVEVFVKATTPGGAMADIKIAGRSYIENGQLKSEMSGSTFKQSCLYRRK